jgi:hypothetical protein
MVAGRMNAFSRSCRDAVMDDLLRARRGGTVLLYRRAGVLVKRRRARTMRENFALSRRRVASQAVAFGFVSAPPPGWMGCRRFMAKSSRIFEVRG